MHKLNLKLNHNSELYKFLSFRINSPDYRGVHYFQHNRFTNDKLLAIVTTFLEISPNNEFLEIPIGDENNATNNGFYVSDYPQYENFCSIFKEKTGYGTPNSIKKNLFPDYARLQIFDRYNENFKKIEPFDSANKSFIKYIKLNNTIFKAYKTEKFNFNIFLFEYSTQKFKDIYSKLIELFIKLLFFLKKITLDEFMLFVSWFNYKNYDGQKITLKTIELYITEFRALTKGQSRSLINSIKQYCDPKKWNNKKDKKDYHNWKNESQEIFNAFKSFGIFVVDSNNTIQLSIEEKQKASFETIINYKRSSKIKDDYFLKHKIQKRKDFDLDHIIPFSYINTIFDYFQIDNLNNLLYISGSKHNYKTRSGNKFFIFDYNDNFITLKANDGECLNLKINEDVLLDIGLASEIKFHNQKLIKSLKLI